MPLPPAPVPRKCLHTGRIISHEGWQRDDGVFDIEARIVDTEDDDYVRASGRWPGGVPVHDMWARVTLERHHEVRQIETCIDGVPYPGGRDVIGPAHAKLAAADASHDVVEHLAKVLHQVGAEARRARSFRIH